MAKVAVERARPAFDWSQAQRAAEAAARKAEELGARVNVSVVDASGTPMAFLRMAGSLLHSMSICEDKAYTAVSFGIPTSAWAEQMKEFSELVRQGLLQRPRTAFFGGGVPIVIDGVLAGAIGVSGASEQQDEQCARAGLAACGWL
jgi:uncharacterized protein GlcG (DUF336 family)